MRLTQQEIEHGMYYGGIERAEKMMDKAEEMGRAHQNPYAKEVFATYVMPLADVIREACVSAKAGRQQAHVVLLRPLDPQSVALIAVRITLAYMMGHLKPMGGLGKENDHHSREASARIGKMVYAELVLAQIEAEVPDLYHHLVNDLGKRLSKNERHRLAVMRLQAKKNGVEIVEWPRGSAEQVGSWLLGMLEVAGMVEIGELYKFKSNTEFRTLRLGAALLARIEDIKEYVAKTMPMWGACVEPPLPWVTPVGGGFHTEQMRRMHPTLVRGSSECKELSRDATMPVVLAAANALQQTAWAVNKRVLATIQRVGGAFSMKEIVSAGDAPKPMRPAFCDSTQPDQMTPEQMAEFKAWKWAMAKWHTDRKLMGTRVGRLSSTLAGAKLYAEYDKIYFVYFADSRGRLYPMTYGLNPQGSDMQKALLHAAVGKPVNTPDAIKWFHVQGANKWGFDKATLAERHQWVVDRQDLILSFADNPLDNTEWKNADKPLQFLAWCFEYADWVRDSAGTFVSRIPISMDGSCNGLQNLSALLRDEIGGAATNLSANSKMRDIYADVAAAATVRLRVLPELTEDELVLRDKWLAHGISRKVVKRSVMTTPYGVTMRSATEYVVSDYLREGLAGDTFSTAEYRKASEVLMKAVWPAIGDVVVKGREAMEWLRSSTKYITKKIGPDDIQAIWWVTPSGFPASQAYFEENVHRINTRIHGVTKIRIPMETDEINPTRHSSGLAPNFVHSMDASHLHLTAFAASAQHSIDFLAMIHDDYGTLAAYSQQLYTIIREQFVHMYEQHDPIQDFYKRYPMVKAPPERGSLNIREVLDSPFFFS